MTLSEIWVYPVKSLGGIRLTKALTEERGLRYDRRWMIIDEENVFITQRAHLKMALIDVALEEGGLKIYLRADPIPRILYSCPTNRKPHYLSPCKYGTIPRKHSRFPMKPTHGSPGSLI